MNNVINENKDINNILAAKILLENRKIFNHMEMILKKFIWGQFTCGKFYTIKSNNNKDKFVIQPRKRSIESIKITMRKEEFFICIERFFKKLERSVEINIDNNIDSKK